MKQHFKYDPQSDFDSYLPYSSLLNCCEQTKVYMDFGLECWRLIVSILMLRNEFWQRSPNGAEGGGGAGTVIPFRDFFKFLLGLRAFPWRMEVAEVPGPTPRSPILGQAVLFFPSCNVKKLNLQLKNHHNIN